VSKFAGEIGVLLITAYGLNNSLLTVFFVTPYRVFTLRLISLKSLHQWIEKRQFRSSQHQQQRGGGGDLVGVGTVQVVVVGDRRITNFGGDAGTATIRKPSSMLATMSYRLNIVNHPQNSSRALSLR
jgi:hypothetical protein